MLLEMRERIVACARVSVRSSAVYNSLRSKKRVRGLKLLVRGGSWGVFVPVRASVLV